MKKSQGFVRAVCLPTAFFYGLVLIVLGVWGTASYNAGARLQYAAMGFSGISLLHFLFTSRKQLGSTAYKPTRALDEWSLLQTDERQVVSVRLLTRITGGVSVVWCLLMLAMTLLAMWDFTPLVRMGQLAGLGFWQSFVLGWVHLALVAFTLTYVLSAWRTHYLA